VLRTHDGYEWIYVLEGRLRMVLGEHDIVMGPGEAAEFDTKNPHWFGSAAAVRWRSSACSASTANASTGERGQSRP
jgi:uncharacterized cupin superfamily protein